MGSKLPLWECGASLSAHVILFISPLVKPLVYKCQKFSALKMALSFPQVRDQRAYLCHVPAQGMMVHWVDKNLRPAPQQAGKRPDEQLQFVLAVTMEDWELMKRVVSPDQTKVSPQRRLLRLWITLWNPKEGSHKVSGC